MSFIDPHMTESLRSHILETVLESEKINAYYMKRPGQGRMMSTLVLFTPEGIVLQGDLTPGGNGSVSAIGYGRNWFSGRLSESYLCEKFLAKVFRPDKAQRAIKEDIIEQRRECSITKARARELWNDMPDGDEHDGRLFYEFYTEELGRDGSDFPAYGYDLVEAGWLCAIQQRFAALYNEAHP